MYAKIYAQIFDSSLREKWQAWVVFVAMLALADADDEVDMTLEALAARTGLPGSIVGEGIAWLEKPDPFSRSPEAEGRRIVRLDDHRAWGWKIVNRGKYKRLRDNTERREYFRVQKQEQRKKAGCPPVSTTVHQSPPQAVGSRQLNQAVDIESKDLSTDVDGVVGSLNRESDPEDLTWGEIFETWFWGRYPRKVGKPAAKKAWNGVRPQTQDTVEAMNEGLGLWEGFWAKKDKDFIPHPATWLNQRRWEDQP